MQTTYPAHWDLLRGRVTVLAEQPVGYVMGPTCPLLSFPVSYKLKWA